MVIITSNAVTSNSIHHNDLELSLGLTEYSVENWVVVHQNLIIFSHFDWFRFAIPTNLLSSCSQW